MAGVYLSTGIICLWAAFTVRQQGFLIHLLALGVLPNGHLLVAGEKQIGVNHNVDVLRFSGQVDPHMIQTGNVVASAQIANVRIEQRGRGAQAEAQGIGWLSRFFLNVLPI